MGSADFREVGRIIGRVESSEVWPSGRLGHTRQIQTSAIAGDRNLSERDNRDPRLYVRDGFCSQSRRRYACGSRRKSVTPVRARQIARIGLTLRASTAKATESRTGMPVISVLFLRDKQNPKEKAQCRLPKRKRLRQKKIFSPFRRLKRLRRMLGMAMSPRFKNRKKERKGKQANLPLMQTTKVEKRGKALLNCKILKAYEGRVSGSKFMFGEEEASGSFEDLKKIVGYINASAKKFNDLFLKYKEPLTLKYEQLIFKDDYGDLDERYVLEEYKNFLSGKTDVLFLVERCDFFYRSKEREKNPAILRIKTLTDQKRLAENFSVKELSSCLNCLSQVLLVKVKEYRASAQYKRAHKADVSFEDLSPYDYEKQVAQSLSEMGWDTQVTKANGDQGCDVLAVKDRARVAIQCKYYSKPIGNKAVQEINAAKSYYDANFAAVVSNQSYTPAAKLLATKLQVALLHHSQLSSLLKECKALKGA